MKEELAKLWKEYLAQVPEVMACPSCGTMEDAGLCPHMKLTKKTSFQDFMNWLSVKDNDTGKL